MSSPARKSPCRFAAGARKRRTRLEKDLQPQLQVEGFTGPDAGGSVEVADGVVDDATAGTGSTDTGSQVDPVEYVKHLHAELGLDPLGDGNDLQHGQIQVREAWAVDLVAAQVAAENTRSASGTTSLSRSGCRVVDTECRRIDPSDTGFAEGMRDPGERVADDVVAGAELIQRLT